MNDRQRSGLLRSGCLAVLFFLIGSPVFAQMPDSLSTDARISVLTANPGTAIHSYWGHSALRIVDPVHGFDAVFNWGTFDPARPWFVPRFAYGDMLYDLSVGPMAGFMQAYGAEERGIIEQILRLDADRKQRIWELIRVNMDPENRSYQYDFVRDNCSTRILDLLVDVEGIVFDGAERPALQIPVTQVPPVSQTMTYRQLIDQYIHQEAWLDLGIDLAFGSPMDRIIPEGEEAFLPLHLMIVLDRADTPEGESLVASTRSLLDIPWQPAERSFDRVQWLFWVLSIVILVFTARSMRSGTLKGPQALDRVLLGFFGFIGAFLLVMWLGTLHWVTGWNLDILWALPTHAVAAIWWKRASWLSMYLQVSAMVMSLVLLLQLSVLQPVPAAFIPLIAVTSWRFWVVGRSASPRPVASPSA